MILMILMERYALIGGTVIVTVLLTSRVLDSLAMPVRRSTSDHVHDGHGDDDHYDDDDHHYDDHVRLAMLVSSLDFKYF